MKYDLDRIVDRKGTASLKWEYTAFAVPGADADTLPLWVADMDFPCARPILDALHERVDREIFGYTMPYDDAYLRSVCGWFERNHGWRIDPQRILVTPGVVPALGAVIRALTQPGDGIIVQPPVYYPFFRMIGKNGRKIVENPLISENGVYRMDFADLADKAKDPGTTMMILCSPHNPVGRVWTTDELRQTAAICRDNGVIPVADEIHCDLLRAGVSFVPMARVTDDPALISCTAASKTFNLAGMQVSNIVFQDSERQQACFSEMRDRLGLYLAGALGITATRAAYDGGQDWLDQVRAYIDGNLGFVDEYLSEHMPRARYRVPEGTYLAWIDLRGYGHSREDLRDLMVRGAKVALDEGYIFGPQGRGFERINVACPRSILDECLRRMAAVLEGGAQPPPGQ